MGNNKTTDETTNLIWLNFQRLFPEKVDNVLKVERAGSKMITIHMDDGLILSFLYYTPTNWNLGTKPWREKPTPRKEEAE